MTLSAFDLIAMLLVLTATFGWINHRFIGLPHTIGMLVMGLRASLLLIAFELALPEDALYEDLTAVVRQIDFQRTVLDGHARLPAVRRRAACRSRAAARAAPGRSALMATVGVADLDLRWSGSASGLLAQLLGCRHPAALGAGLRRADQPDRSGRRAVDAEGGAGAGVARDRHERRDPCSTTASASWCSPCCWRSPSAGGRGTSTSLHVAELFLRGGAAAARCSACVAGYIAYRAMRAIDDYPIEVLISLGAGHRRLCAGGQAASERTDRGGGRRAPDRQSRPARRA